MKKLALHWKILIGMALGVLFALILVSSSWGQEKVEKFSIEEKAHWKTQITEGNATQVYVEAKESTIYWTKAEKFINHWVAPWGVIFINLLKLIAIPLILASLIKGISDLKNISKFKKMGLRTIVIYIGTTLVAICIGLIIVNVVQPGNGISDKAKTELASKYSTSSSLGAKIEEAKKQGNRGPLEFIVEMVPGNIFDAMANNGKMLQVIFFTILFGVSLILADPDKVMPMKRGFDALNEIIMKMVDIIMLMAPFAVFSLLASVIANTGDPALLFALIKYALAVLAGLALMIVFHLIIIKVYAKKSPFWFLKQISPAQLVAFSTSSSAATLPVTMERVEEHIGVDKEVSSFVLPVGATINMDGTSLYQAVASVFILQVLWPEGITMSNQLTIIFTALLASIGSAAVPGAGMVMLIIVLEAIGFPSEQLAIALALIFAVDRPLDMCRTMVNVTGDAMVSTVVAKSLGKLHHPKAKNWDDNYEKVQG